MIEDNIPGFIGYHITKDGELYSRRIERSPNKFGKWRKLKLSKKSRVKVRLYKGRVGYTLSPTTTSASRTTKRNCSACLPATAEKPRKLLRKRPNYTERTDRLSWNSAQRLHLLTVAFPAIDRRPSTDLTMLCPQPPTRCPSAAPRGRWPGKSRLRSRPAPRSRRGTL